MNNQAAPRPFELDTETGRLHGEPRDLLNWLRSAGHPCRNRDGFIDALLRDDRPEHYYNSLSDANRALWRDAVKTAASELYP
jgi:hypothetical protein